MPTKDNILFLILGREVPPLAGGPLCARVSLRGNSSNERKASIVGVTVVPLLVVVYAPFMRARVRASLARELRLRVHALELAVTPQRPVDRVRLAAVDANELSILRVRHAPQAKLLLFLLLLAPRRHPAHLPVRVGALVRP